VSLVKLLLNAAPASKELRDRQARRDLPGRMVPMAKRVLTANQARTEKSCQAQLEMRHASCVQQAHRVHRATKVPRERKDQRESRVLPGCQEHRAPEDPQGHVEDRVSQVNLGRKAPLARTASTWTKKDQLADLDPKDHKDLRDPWDLPDPPEMRDHRASKATRVTPESREKMAFQVNLERQGNLVDADHLEAATIVHRPGLHQDTITARFRDLDISTTFDYLATINQRLLGAGKIVFHVFIGLVCVCTR